MGVFVIRFHPQWPFVLLAASDPQEQDHKCGPPWAIGGLGKRTVSAQKEAKQLLLKGGIWCIAHRQVHPGGLLHNAFLVGEGIKAQFAVVAAHAAVTHTSKAHPAGSQMDNGVVDAAPAKGDLAEEPLLGGPILGKQI